MARTYIGEKIEKVIQNQHGEWEVVLSNGNALVFYADGIGNPETHSYIKTPEDAQVIISQENEEKD